MARRRSKFPWGLALLGVGAYLYFTRKPAAAAAPVTTVPTVTDMTNTTSAAPVQLPASSPSDQQIVLQWAQQVGKPNFLAFAQNGTPAELATMAQIITQEWNVAGSCQTAWCNQNWAMLKTKYSLI